MIPRSLSLTNFMCYRWAELDLTGINVACLAGDNGAGKSALLDAITWALWGKARARRDDELIHLGEDEMAVELAFELGGQLYRVLRQRSARKRGTTVLDFQMQDDGHWRSVAESGIRLTQEKIERVLRLDYDTFVNSAFLRQGHADEFTVKTAAERKRVLGDILALDRWAGYEERVKDEQRALQEEADLTELRLEDIEAELARRPEYEAAMVDAQAAVLALSAALQAAQEAYRAVETARTELRHVESQAADLAKRVVQAEQELETLAEETEVRRRRLDEYRQLLTQADEIETGYTIYREAVKREEMLGAKLRQSVELSERRIALESAITDARRQIEAERTMAGQHIVDLENQLPDEVLRAEYDDVQAQLTHMAQLAEGREAAREDLLAIANEQAELRARNDILRAEMEDLKERLALLERAQADCPTCGQPLSDEHRLELLQQSQNEGRIKGNAYRTNQEATKALAERAQALQRQIIESDRLLAGLAGLQRQEAALIERFERGRRAAKELEQVQKDLAKIERRLAEDDYAHAERDQLAQVLAAAAELGYDVAAHEAARQAVTDGHIFAERKAQLGTVEARISEEEQALHKLSETSKRWREQREAEQARRSASLLRAEELMEHLDGAPKVEADLQRLRGEEATARQRLGANLQRLEACKALSQQRDDKLRRRDVLAAEQAIFDELRTAFGVRGVPAMIIEAAVPEIEAEANQLLVRMSAGRMHVRFDTQRETLAGEVRETLEIKIADELGERPYENYSGGEQFRVNFAIRIALSKLLARRAGAQLQTLVIDEGFGTQDAQGRERLVEAINVIQKDFAQILVITHIDELKDAFPVRIEVTKTPDGSIATIT